MTDGEAAIYLCALRYALGRQTYVVSLVVTEIKRRLDEIPEHTRMAMARDIDEAASRDGGLGADIDARYWRRLREQLR